MKSADILKSKKYLYNISCIAIFLFIFSPLMALSAETQMTGAQLKQLLEEGKTLILGGEGEGYTGELELYPDGTGKGQWVTNKGKKGKIEGTWEIVGDEFCRVWKEVSGGKRVCERWIIVGENKVEVRKKKNGKYTKAGINSW